jgi:xylulokinase
MDTDQAVMWRSVLEAIGYDYIGVTDIYKKAGVDLSIITVTEGGSRSGIWNQIKADMIDSTVVTLKTAQGAVMTDAATAAYAVGDIDNLKDVFENNLIIKDVYKPKKKNTEYYRKIYELKSELVSEDMKTAFDKLDAIRNTAR